MVGGGNREADFIFALRSNKLIVRWKCVRNFSHTPLFFCSVYTKIVHNCKISTANDEKNSFSHFKCELINMMCVCSWKHKRNMRASNM